MHIYIHIYIYIHTLYIYNVLICRGVNGPQIIEVMTKFLVDPPGKPSRIGSNQTSPGHKENDPIREMYPLVK